MKLRFLFLFILFLGMGSYTFGQSAADAQAVKQDDTKNELVLKSTTTENSQANDVSKADCKWKDANKDGLCDICGKKDCGKKSVKTGAPMSNPSGCPVKSSCGKKTCCSSKDGKKPE